MSGKLIAKWFSMLFFVALMTSGCGTLYEQKTLEGLSGKTQPVPQAPQAQPAQPVPQAPQVPASDPIVQTLQACAVDAKRCVTPAPERTSQIPLGARGIIKDSIDPAIVRENLKALMPKEKFQVTQKELDRATRRCNEGRMYDCMILEFEYVGIDKYYGAQLENDETLLWGYSWDERPVSKADAALWWEEIMNCQQPTLLDCGFIYMNPKPFEERYDGTIPPRISIERHITHWVKSPDGLSLWETLDPQATTTYITLEQPCVTQSYDQKHPNGKDWQVTVGKDPAGGNDRYHICYLPLEALAWALKHETAKPLKEPMAPDDPRRPYYESKGLPEENGSITPAGVIWEGVQVPVVCSSGNTNPACTDFVNGDNPGAVFQGDRKYCPNVGVRSDTNPDWMCVEGNLWMYTPELR